MNEFYNHAGYPATNASGASASMRAELDSIASGFDKLPPLAGNALKTVRVNAAGTALETSNAVSIPVTSLLLKGDGAGGLTTATSSTDYAPATSGSTLLKANGSGGFSSAGAVPTGLVKGDGSTLSAAVAGTDYQTAQSVTGIVKSTGTTRSAATAGTDYAKPDTVSTWSASQRGTLTTDNDLSFDLSVTNNFFCTPTAGGALTFTNHTSGQSGFIKLVNGSNYAITAAATTKVDSSLLSTISATGTYILTYFDDGTNAYVVGSKALA